MAYNPYGAPGYGPPPSYAAFPGAAVPPGMAPPPGLGPPPGMSSAPGLAPPPGVQQPNTGMQANRPSGIPASFQAPPNLPNINFNAPVIRLGSTAAPTKPGSSLMGDRKDSSTPTSSHRPGLGMDRGLDHSRAQLRESMQSLVPPTSEERLRTIFVHKIPDGVGGEDGIQRLLNTVGKVRRWDSAHSHLTDHKGKLFGFAQYEDPDSLAVAVELLKDVEVPVKKQAPTENAPKDENKGDEDSFEGTEKAKLQVTVDPNTIKYLESWQESRGDDAGFQSRLSEARDALKQFIRNLFYPRLGHGKDADGDTSMGDGTNGLGGEVEVINIPLAQDDELADIPAEMREMVAKEIAAFRERSNKRDLERLRREEEFEEMERQRNGAPRISRLDSPQPSAANSNMIPLGPRGVPNAPSGPRGQNRGMEFVNGGTTNGHSHFREEDDTDASDEELYERERSKQRAEDEKVYLEAERKWVNRERQRAAALDREREREKAETEGFARRKEEQLEREKSWDDEREATRKGHLYYRDHAQWVRNRTREKQDEEHKDEMDRRAEEEERRKQEAEMEQARGMADSFLERQAQEMERRPAETAAPAAPQRFTISFGAAAQKAQAQRGSRRTIAEVEGLLDDEEQEQTTKRQLVPIKFEPITDTKAMSEEDLQKAVRALAQEIPTDSAGLWAWDVKWDYLEESIIREKLRPFVEKKVVEYLGVQEQFLVDVVEEHLRKHEKPAELVEELAQALDEDAEDLVKKLWRMVIFFTESEKRGLPA
ncbi:RNA-binding protein 25 [Diplogelasinospora grovesii]|uniref:RNA-binding protein 25 n=1 Tax=Diplogelasinospora grovesii TaxID=303347 RepID=A0AAN6N6V8_9PEZI|nr:RNA-binding protein 25 [Diplogelasinospora grovesii]